TSALEGERVVALRDKAFRRDIVYIAAIAGGIARMLLADRLAHDTYNVGWGHDTSAEETIAALTRIVPDAEVEWAPDRPSPWIGPGNVPRGPLRCDRLRQDVGWQPRYDLDSGLAAYIDWLRRHH